MNHCPDCGEVIDKLSDNHFRCSSCTADHYINPKAGVGIITLIGNEEVLLGIRAKQPNKGRLDTFGGFVDVGENLEQALYRELKEETSITAADILSVSYLMSSYDPYPWQGGIVPVMTAHFVVNLREGVSFTASDDVESIKQYSLAELDLSELAWKSVGEALTLLRQRL